MKTINVVAAIIIKDDKIFATQRGYGDFKGKWEFPGGKIESNETPEEALKREIIEEKVEESAREPTEAEIIARNIENYSGDGRGQIEIENTGGNI